MTGKEIVKGTIKVTAEFVYTPACGETIQECIKNMILLSKSKNIDVTGLFNNINIKVKPQSNYIKVLSAYYYELNERVCHSDTYNSKEDLWQRKQD